SPDFGFGEDRDRLLLMAIQLFDLGRPFELALLILDGAEQAQPSIQTSRTPFGQGEGGRLKDRLGSVLEICPLEAEAVRTGPVAEGTFGGNVQVPGFPARTESAGVLSGADAAGFVDARLRQDDGRRQVVPAAGC